MRLLIILVLAWLPSLSLGQVFNLDTTHTNGAPHVGELIFANGDKYIGTRSSLAKYQLDNTAVWGYGIGSSNNCLHNNSRFKDLALLSNGSLAGIFYHDESCITPESAFVMLDSNGNVLVDKRFAKGISLFNAGVLQKDSVVHVYANHFIGNYEQGGLTHFQYSLNGSLLDTVVMITDFYQGYNSGIKRFGDSLLVIYSKYVNQGTYIRTISMTDFDISGKVRIISGDTLNGITTYKVYDNSIVYIFGRGNYSGYRSGIATVDINGQNLLQDTSTLGSYIEYGDVIKMKDYFVVTEYNHSPGHSYQNLIIYDSNLTIIHRQLVNHNVNQSKFIKTSDSTFLIYDDSYTYEYTMNFDSIPGYVSSVSNLVATNGSELELKVFPNPSASMVTITYPISPQTRVRIFSVSGVELSQHRVTYSTETTIDLSQYPKGIYLLQVKTNRGMKTVKLVRE